MASSSRLSCSIALSSSSSSRSASSSTSLASLPSASSSSSFLPSRRSLSTSTTSRSEKSRRNYIPKATKSSLMTFKSAPNSWYPQNQFQPEANKTADGLDRQTHKAAFLGAKFVASAAEPKSLPPKGKLQEILFAGRANTGKSSLLNALLSSEHLVKVSKTPGHTQMLNFFEVPNQFVFVDAPGYGERGRPEWGDTFQFFLTHRPPSPPSLILSLFDLTHKLAQSDLYFLASLPPSIPLLPIFTKVDLCPLHEIIERKKNLNNQILAARDSAYLEAVARDRRRRMAKLSEEFEGWQDEAGLEEQKRRAALPAEELVKGKTWDGMVVSTKKGWVMRDKTVDLVRGAILTQLQSTLATDQAHREAHLRDLARRKQEIKELANGDRVESARMFRAMGEERNQVMEDFFASVPGHAGSTDTNATADSAAKAYGVGGTRGLAEMDQEEEELEAWEAERRDAARKGEGVVQSSDMRDPYVGSAFGRTQRGKGRSPVRNWARQR